MRTVRVAENEHIAYKYTCWRIFVTLEFLECPANVPIFRYIRSDSLCSLLLLLFSSAIYFTIKAPTPLDSALCS